MSRTKETLSTLLGRRLLASLPICLVSSIAILSLGCISRGEIRASIWLNNGSDPELCGPTRAQSPHPELWDRGFYRRLNGGGFDFISFCNPLAAQWVGIYRADLEAILNETLPKADVQAVMAHIDRSRIRRR